MTTKALVVLSGGMDSATALYRTKPAYDVTETVSFDYGQRHRTELQYAHALAVGLNVPWDCVDLTDLGSFLTGSALTDPSVEVPEGHYAADSMKSTVVPNRNMIMLSIACGIATARGSQSVVVGVHAGDHFVYPDCRPMFIQLFNHTVRTATEGFADLIVDAPFLMKTKAQIVSEGEQYGVPWKGTWSCYKGAKVHCGKCGTCTERREAFSLAGVIDPTKYETHAR